MTAKLPATGFEPPASFLSDCRLFRLHEFRRKNSGFEQCHSGIRFPTCGKWRTKIRMPRSWAAVRFPQERNGTSHSLRRLARFEWTDLTADGVTDMGKALRLVADQLKIPPMTDGLPPVLVLISDGQPTDDFNGGLKA